MNYRAEHRSKKQCVWHHIEYQLKIVVCSVVDDDTSITASVFSNLKQVFWADKFPSGLLMFAC